MRYHQLPGCRAQAFIPVGGYDLQHGIRRVDWGWRRTWNLGMIKIHPGSAAIVDGLLLMRPITPANSYRSGATALLLPGGAVKMA